MCLMLPPGQDIQSTLEDIDPTIGNTELMASESPVPPCKKSEMGEAEVGFLGNRLHDSKEHRNPQCQVSRIAQRR